MDKIGFREVIHIGGYAFNEHTIIMSWITMALVIVVAMLGARKVKEVPTGWQNAVEAIAEVWENNILTSVGKDGLFLTPIFLTLFFYLVIGNWLGLCPAMESPTNDINVTLSMAVYMSFFMNHGVGIYKQGIGHLKHFIQPFAPFIIVNIIEELARPASLAFRLFGNIFAGEVLIIIMLNLAPWWGSWIPSTAWVIFSIAVGIIQAYIFTMLSLTYVGPSAHAHHE